jgi:replicative DNA helicase
MDQSLLNRCLSQDFFENNKSKLRPALFDETSQEIYKCIEQMHDKFETDVTPLELFSYWKSQNPTSTGAWTAEVQDVINSIGNAPEIKDEIASDVIESLWRQSIGLDVANLGILMSEGEASAMDKLNQLLDRVSSGYLPDNFEQCIVTDDIYELLAVVSDDNRFKFNIDTLSRHVYGLARGEFGVIAAYSNVGKTAFAISLCASPAGFCAQGAKVGYIANEEVGKRTKLRAIQCYTGMTVEEVEFDPAAAHARYAGIRDRLIFADSQGWDIQQLDAFLAQQKFDVVIVDMADKIALTQQFNSGHERLRELYYRLRELAKKHNCALIGLSQASAEAEGKTRLTPTMLEGSKVGKIAETDCLIGLGKLNDPDNPDDPTRWITVMKNKISGWHGTIICNLNQKTSRYEV